MNDQTLRMLAIVLAIGAVLLGYFGLQLSAAPASSTLAAGQQFDDQYSVIIAKRTIGAGSAIKEKDLDAIQVPVQREASFNSMAKLIDQVPVIEIAAGEIILESHFRSGSHMARLLNAGERAIAINVTEVIGGGGYVQPGDYVDVLLYLRGGNMEVKRSVARTLLKRVQVLAYGKSLATSKTGLLTSSDGKTTRAEGSTRSAVLAVPRDEVERLMLAENAGVIRLALVSSREIESNAAPPQGRTVSISSLTTAPRPVPKGPRIPVYRGSNRTFEPISR